jgi:beta-carotene 3-hydroxylase
VSTVVLAVAVFALMEPVAAFAHRGVMHGLGWRWHRSHHRVRYSVLEANDFFPAIFATVTVIVMGAASSAGRPAVVAAGVGVSAYGVLYVAVHDVCVHGRLTVGRPVLPGRYLQWVAAGHAVHHRGSRAPYGSLAPIVPSRYRNAVISLRGADTVARVENTS